MSEIILEVNALIDEMDSAGKFDDDIFISFLRGRRSFRSAWMSRRGRINCLRRYGKTARNDWEKLLEG